MRVENYIKQIKTLLSVLRIYKWSALFLLFLMIASSFAETLGLGMILPLLELIANPNNTEAMSLKLLNPVLKHFSPDYAIMVVCVLLIIFIILKNILVVFRIGFGVHFAYRYRQLWSNEIMTKYICAEYPYLLSQKQGALINNIIIEPDNSSILLRKLIDFFSRIVTCSFFYGLMLLLNFKITLIISAASIFVFFILRKTTYRYSIDTGKKRLSLNQQQAASAAENISGVRQIKTFSVEKSKAKHFAELLKEYLRIVLKFRIIQSLPKPVTESIVVTGIAVGLIYLKYVIQIPLNAILPTIGTFVAVMQKLYPQASQLFSDRMNILNFVPSLKLVNDIYQERVGQEDLNQGSKIDHLTENIIFDDVYFQYSESNKLFKGVNLEIPKGKITAIIGSSGEGKSTIVDLLFGLYKPDKGKILINQIDLQKIRLKSWRHLTGYVSQDVFLFNSTVKENILIGKPQATDHEIQAAARQANADDFISKLPQGYDSIIGDRGLKLSGGQRQRIAIARVLIRDPEIIIFDEATSAVDSETEQMIQECIRTLSQTKTIIIISHRETTIQNADVIYNLENGVITKNQNSIQTKSIVN